MRCLRFGIQSRYILDKPQVAGVIIGTRLGISEHIDETDKIFSFKLDQEDIDAIEKEVEKGNKLPGDCGDEYR
jgi:aryl-alcohol dehydrogenase-like predicted oxidoreductase